ncbi:DUF692 family multinuclear iron-containing protein [Fluviicola taffensis]|uniref:Xylose isomerase domain-containing protein TIM barrel n=1 Tax=Fluviicola taffensis (strain DSM 16823 / NCIMB 13979 / RW262) TaxID=755732 RepID=F2IFD8_FLUTR|nr:DUF692 family multinuclear iron-containing protein [Fluviicola taffensis]AEA44623.1 protein of unknown function DUF692 [Fluviicola taffensis DSM 16823]
MSKEPLKIQSGVSCNLDNSLLQATLPLFAAEKVEAIEWSFDTLYKVREIPEWFVELLHAFGNEGRLIGHGVYFSLFSGKWTAEQQRWLDHLRKVSSNFTFNHITEHFGFLTGEDFHKGAPISVPYTTETLNIGIDRLKRIQEACSCPVGLENLAFSYSLEEVQRQGEFLERLIEPVNGFIILDLHNLYCQLQNFSLDFETLIQAYPLDRVREIHISGGSWESSGIHPQRTIRRDTHDDAVPEAVFELLKQTLPLCRNLQFVVLEQLGVALHTLESQQQFQTDFNLMQSIVNEFNAQNQSISNADFLPKEIFQLNEQIPESVTLHQQQLELSSILEHAPNYEEATRLLSNSSLAYSAWKTEAWSPYMLETALRIAQKWKQGW